MTRTTTFVLAAGALSFGASGSVLPFVETFNSGNANWLDAGFGPAAFTASGALDGSGFISSELSFAGSTADNATRTVVGLRGNSDNSPLTPNASNDAFRGNWITGQIVRVSVDVRHNAAAASEVFLRVATPNNFPGAITISSVAVAANEWTTVSFAINPALFIYEGPPTLFPTIFGNVGSLQVGLRAPDALLGDASAVRLDIDNVRIVPAPSIVGAFAAAGLVAGRRRRTA